MEVTSKFVCFDFCTTVSHLFRLWLCCGHLNGLKFSFRKYVKQFRSSSANFAKPFNSSILNNSSGLCVPWSVPILYLVRLRFDSVCRIDYILIWLCIEYICIHIAMIDIFLFLFLFFLYLRLCVFSLVHLCFSKWMAVRKWGKTVVENI